MARMSPELWERIPPEAQVIFLEMADTIQRLERRVEELDRRRKQSPENSSLPLVPTSARQNRTQTEASGRKPGGQPGDKRHERALVPPDRVDETIVLKPDACRCCGRRLSGANSQSAKQGPVAEQSARMQAGPR